MARTPLQEFWELDFQLSPFERLPEISDDVQQTLARLLGWTDKESKFVRLRSSGDGVLFVQQVATDGRYQQATQFNINDDPDLVLPARPNRVSLLFKNLSANPVEIGFTNTLTYGFGLPIAAGEVYIDNNWKGEFYATDNGLNGKMYVQEYVSHV